MQIRLLDAAGARQLYESRMARDFPPGELKPFAAVEELLAAGLYEPLTFTDDAGAVLGSLQMLALLLMTVSVNESAAVIPPKPSTL